MADRLAKANAFLRKYFVHLISVNVVLGSLLPQVSNGAKDLAFFAVPGGGYFDLPTLSLWLMMMSASTAVDPRDFARIVRAPIAFVLAVVLFYALFPALGWGAAMTMKSVLGSIGTQLAAGVLLVVLMPVAMTSNIWVRLARGDLSLLVSMITLTTALSAIVTPAYLAALLDLSRSDVHVPTGALVRQFVICVVTPLAIGTALRHFATRWVRRWQPLFTLSGAFGLHVAVFANVGVAVPQLRHAAPVVLIALVGSVLLLNALNFLVGYSVGRMFDLDYAEGCALSFASGMRSNGTALVIGLKAFPAYPLVTAPAAVYIVSQHFIAGTVTRLLHRHIPDAETVLDRDALWTRLRALPSRFRRPRRVTLTLVSAPGSSDGEVRALAALLRQHTNAADLVAVVEPTTIAIAFVARHSFPPDILPRLRALCAPGTRVATASVETMLPAADPDRLYARCKDLLASASAAPV